MIQLDVNNINSKSTMHEYELYCKMFKLMKVDLNSKVYQHYEGVVGWIFVEREADPGSFHYMLKILNLLQSKKWLIGTSKQMAMTNAEKSGFDFEKTKKEYRRKYNKYFLNTLYEKNLTF